ncbi:MAG TPA: TolC family protein [Bacteroidales bacterium]|nr:TolC family protein [Bacteroidales bacterium]
MKRNFFVVLVVSLILCGNETSAQVNEMMLSLEEARQYAVANNKMVKSARMDVEASGISVWETISSALPRVEATGSFADNLKLMTTLLPGEFFGQPGEKIPVTFGSKYNSGASIQASMVLFNAPLFIGIEATKLAKKLTEENLIKTELEIRESVSSIYYLTLVSERTLIILEEDIANLSETLRSTQAMYAAGMAEATDVDQMLSNVTMVENSRSSLERTIELNYNLLRFQLGVSPETSLILTETLESLIEEINVEAILSSDFDLNNNVEYRLVEGQEILSTLDLKSWKASTLPTLAGFYNYGTSGMGDKISELRWFPNSMTGLQVSLPLFASGQRYMQIRKAQINLDRARTTKALVSDQLKIQEKQLRYNLMSANLQYQSQRDNVEVSKRVYASMENKYRQGMASSLELTQANSIYLQAENNYLTALMNLLQTKLSLDKLLNNI